MQELNNQFLMLLSIAQDRIRRSKKNNEDQARSEPPALGEFVFILGHFGEFHDDFFIIVCLKELLI